MIDLAIPVAHHLVLAIPFAVPALTITLGLLAITLRDRLRRRRGSS